MNKFCSVAHTRISIPLILVILLGEIVSANQKSIQVLVPNLKAYCQNLYDLQQAYQSEIGHFAASIETINSSQNTNFPDFESGYKVKIKAGNGFFICQLINQENDTLTLSNSGELKRGNDLLFDFSIKEAVQSNRSLVKKKVINKNIETKASFPVVVRKMDTTQLFEILKKKFRVVKTTALINKKYAFNKTDQEFKLVDEKNKENFKYNENLNFAENGFDGETHFDFIQLVGASWKSVLIIYSSLPSAPPTGNQIQVLNLSSDSVKLLLPKYLDIVKIVQNEIEKKDNIIRLENDVLNTIIYARNFELIFPFKIVFDSNQNSIVEMKLFPIEYNAKDGYVGFKIKTSIHPEQYAEGQEITVSKSRDFSQPKKIKVPPLKEINILSAEIPMNKSIFSNPIQIIDSVYKYDLIIVKIKISGVVYWIKLEDTEKIGFPAFG